MVQFYFDLGHQDWKRIQLSKKLKRFKCTCICTDEMLRQIGDSSWEDAKDYLQLHPEKTYAIAKNLRETLEEALKSEWCYVVERKGETFEQVTYHYGIERDRR